MEYNHYKYYYNLKLETIILLNQKVEDLIGTDILQ